VINGKKVLGIIPARGGSKGLPKKNIKNLCGKPLIAWTIDSARTSLYLDRLILSSDDDEIIEVARAYSCEAPFKRDKSLAGDQSSTVDVVIDAIQRVCGYDWIVILQPTSPFRTGSDIDNALELCMKNKSTSCVSVTLTEHHPNWMYQIDTECNMKPIIQGGSLVKRRQDLPELYNLNGAIYAINSEHLKRTKALITESTLAYKMPENRSIDIDTENDFIWAEYLALKQLHTKL
jgi:N-acylneuraminate cytidylyltransferase